MDSKVAPYLDYIRAELIKLRAEYVFSAALASNIYDYLKELRGTQEGSKALLNKLVKLPYDQQVEIGKNESALKAEDKHSRIIKQIKEKYGYSRTRNRVVKGDELIKDIANAMNEYEVWELDNNAK